LAAELKQGFFWGIIHGDLHPGNLIVNSVDDNVRQFWLIDLALARVAPLFYDHAYLEIALLISHLEGLGVERLFGILRALDASAKTVSGANVPAADVGIVIAVRKLRLTCDEWQKTKEPKRFDSYKLQSLLARIAVGINWANKPLSDSARNVAVAYAGWAARHFVQMYHRNDYPSVMSDAGSANKEEATTATSQAPVPLDTDSSEWRKLWAECSQFDESTARFILITGRLTTTLSTSLGLLPWTVVVDLDPRSSEDGLHFRASALLSKSRLVNQLSRRNLEDAGLRF
jgi:hypothetical protein